MVVVLAARLEPRIASTALDVEAAAVKTMQRTTKPQPYDHVTWCPLCGIELDVHRRADRLTTRTSIAITEAKIKEHLRIYHRFRYTVWSWLGKRTTKPWRWLITGFGA